MQSRFYLSTLLLRYTSIPRHSWAKRYCDRWYEGPQRWNYEQDHSAYHV